MEEKLIELEFQPAEFKQLYYDDNKYMNFLNWRGIKTYLRILAVLAILSFFFYLFALESDKFLVPFVMGVFCLIFLSIIIIAHYKKYYTWKSSIDRQLGQYAENKLHKCILYATHLEIVQGKDITLTNWENIINVSIKETHMVLTNSLKESFLLPTKSMDRKVYEQFEAFIKQYTFRQTS